MIAHQRLDATLRLRLQPPDEGDHLEAAVAAIREVAGEDETALTARPPFAAEETGFAQKRLQPGNVTMDVTDGVEARLGRR